MFKVGDKVVMLDTPDKPAKIEELVQEKAIWKGERDTLHARLEGLPNSRMNLSQLTPEGGFTGPFGEGEKKRAPIPNFDSYKEQVWEYDPEGKGQFVYRVINDLLLDMGLKNDFLETAETLPDGGTKEVYLHKKFAVLTFWREMHWDIIPIALDKWEDFKPSPHRGMLYETMDAGLLNEVLDFLRKEIPEILNQAN